MVTLSRTAPGSVLRRRRLSSAATHLRPERPAGRGVVDVAVYANGRRVEGVGSYLDALRQARKSGGFAWIGLHEPTSELMNTVAKLLGLHPLAIEDAMTARQRPKLEDYSGVTFVAFTTACYRPDAAPGHEDLVRTGQVFVFLGPDFVVTVRQGPHRELGGIRRHLERHPELLEHGPAVVLHAVADRIVDDFVEVADKLNDDMDEVETAVFTSRSSREIERVYQLKRQILDLKRATVPLGKPLAELSTGGVAAVDEPTRNYFRDVADNLSRVIEQVESFDNLLDSILQANLAMVAVKENEDMRKISAWAAILATITAITGLYGMNFRNMPELRWTLGYPVVVGLIVLISIILWRGFRRSGWL
jgi:magnesium transporter